MIRLALLATALATAPAASPPKACVTEAEAQSLALVALPEIIRQTGIVCAAELPADSLVRRTTGPFLEKYQAAADRAWPDARAAIGKFTDPTVALLLQSQYARPLLTTLLVPQLVGRIAPRDCPVVGKLVDQLAPLPPANTANVIVTTLQYLKGQKAQGKPVEVPDLPLCPATPAGGPR